MRNHHFENQNQQDLFDVWNTYKRSGYSVPSGGQIWRPRVFSYVLTYVPTQRYFGKFKELEPLSLNFNILII